MTNPWNLTPREVDVMAALAQHGCSKLASRVCHLAPQTVDAYVQRVMQRMEVRNRMQAVVMWDRWAQLHPVMPQLAIGELERLNVRLATKLRRAATAARVARVTTEAA